jgi:hypothetical protein
MINKIMIIMLTMCFSSFSNSADMKNHLSIPQIEGISSKLYLYMYSLVTMDITRKKMLLDKNTKENQFTHLRKYPEVSYTDVVRPNFDTLYSIAWLDLSAGPVRVMTGDSNGRYYLMPYYDMYSDVIGTTGTMTTGNGKQMTTIYGPNYKGEYAAGNILKSSTQKLWIIGRTKTDGPSDYVSVNKFQDTFKIIVEDSRQSLPEIDIKFNPKLSPLEIVNSMKLSDFFRYGNELVKMNGYHDSDNSLIFQGRRMGFFEKDVFDFKALPIKSRQAMSMGVLKATALLMKIKNSKQKLSNGWSVYTSLMGVYGNEYAFRSFISMIGLGALPTQDSVYPVLMSDANGNDIVGEKNYIIHFDKKDLPPVKAFWSLTMYDNQGFAVANSLNRYTIGSKDSLKFNKDGSLDIYIQHKKPSDSLVSNWLPAPAKGNIGVTMRLYSPDFSVITGKWIPPVVRETSTNRKLSGDRR